jgi:diacylglycerol kinase (ATP)
MRKQPENPNSMRARFRSFRHAFNGIRASLLSQPNLRIHLIAAAFVVVFGFIVDLNRLEWLAICLAIGAVLSAEIMNSAVEQLTDLVSPEKNPRAGMVKDMAAGAVLIAAIAAAVLGLIIFIPKIVVLL